MKAKAQGMMMVFVLAGSLFVAVGCEQDGPAEQAGESIDKTMEKAGDKLEEAGEKIQDTAN